MDPNKSQFLVDDVLNESDFTAVSSIGGDIKQIAEKIQKLENIVVMKNANCSNNGDQSGMMLGLQIGEKFGELRKDMMAIVKENGEMKDGMAKMMKTLEELTAKNAEKDNVIEGMKKAIEGLKAAKDEENRAFEELKDEYGHKLREMAELITQIGGKNAELEGKILEKGHEMEKMNSAFNGLKNEFGGKNAELSAQITGLKEEEEKLKEKMAEMQGQFGEMGKLTEQIGGIEWVKYDWLAYKLDAANCGPKLTISEGGFIAKHSGPNGINTVLANLPIPAFNSSVTNKSKIAFYFEVQILQHTNMLNGDYIDFGFCKQFPLGDSWLGNKNTDSIGFYRKGGILIDGTTTKLGNADGTFKEGDFVGIGIIHHKTNSKMECFATWNGQLMGKAALPSKFLDLPLFPAINLYYVGDSIRANFDKNNCQFKEFERALQ